MSPNAQRIAIAKACGWLQATEYNSLAGWHKMNNKIVDEFFCKRLSVKDYDNGVSVIWRTTSELPNYLNDLNAMHYAESMLTVDQVINQAEWLGASNNEMPIKSRVALLRATAAQRAEAFLRTIGKWEDTP